MLEPGILGARIRLRVAGRVLLQRIVRAIDMRVTVEVQHRLPVRHRIRCHRRDNRLVVGLVGRRVGRVPHVGLADETMLWALSPSASLNAAPSHRMSAAVRAARSASSAAWFLAGPFHVSVSLFEPPGMLSVTKTVFDCSHMTFSTNWASVGYAGSCAIA